MCVPADRAAGKPIMLTFPATVLCTTGLAAEARIARAAGFSTVVGAGDRDRTAALVETRGPAGELPCQLWYRRRSRPAVARGRRGHLDRGVVRFGALAAGGLVSDSGRRAWRPGLALSRVRCSASRGSCRAPAEKRRTWAQTGALAVDLESDVVARIADIGRDSVCRRAHDRRHGIPRAAARGADPAG